MLGSRGDTEKRLACASHPHHFHRGLCDRTRQIKSLLVTIPADYGVHEEPHGLRPGFVGGDRPRQAMAKGVLRNTLFSLRRSWTRAASAVRAISPHSDRSHGRSPVTASAPRSPPRRWAPRPTLPARAHARAPPTADAPRDSLQ